MRRPPCVIFHYFPLLRSPSVLLGMLLALATLSLNSCRTAHFYTQAIGGQMDILAKAKPIEKVQSSPRTPEKLRQQLALVQEIRTYAHDTLKLPTDKQYRTYADLGRNYVVWNVVAAPEFSLEARTWSYPFLGKLKYRGFFHEKDARDEAARIKSQGDDVAVGGVRVYSTLGVFRDPVLNTFIDDDPEDLAETLFHELTHARLYVPGDTDFNEAYATATAQIAVRAWLRAKGNTAVLARYESHLARQSRVLALLKDTRAELKALYAKSDTVDETNLRNAKACILNHARERYAAMQRRGELPGTVSLSKNLNNARLAALATYHDLVPAFTRLYHECGSDWETYHRRVESMRVMTKAERRTALHFESHKANSSDNISSNPSYSLAAP